MAIINTSLAAAGSTALATAASTGLSQPELIARIETAVTDLRSLDACCAQWGDRIDQPIYLRAANRAIESLREIQGQVPAVVVHIKDVQKLLDRGRRAEAVDPLLKALDPLQAQLVEVRGRREKRLLAMNQIVNGGDPVAGLPHLETVLSHYSSAPDWTKAVGRLPSGVEVSFLDGQFWVHDSRDVSLFDPRNWIRRWFGGLFVGQDGAMRLSPGVRWPVMPGDKVRLGRKTSVQLLLPRAPILETLKGRIAAVKNLEELSTLLRENGVSEIADQIDQFIRFGGQFHNIPDEGGLSLKIQELVLQRSFAEIHQRYLSGLPEGVALQMLRSLAVVVQNASSRKELIDVANTSIVPGVFSIARGMAKVFSKDPDASYKDTPEMCGFQNGVLRFSSAADRELRDRLARLAGDAQDLS